MSFPAKDGGKRLGVGVCVCSRIPKKDIYIQAHFSKIFFIVWCIYCSVG